MKKNKIVISCLVVTDLRNLNIVALQHCIVYSQKSLPVTRKDIFPVSELDKWSYLRDVQLDRIDSDIGLLIGVSVSKVMEPWEVIPSQDGGPFAVETVFGWVVNGSLGTASHETVSVNRIGVSLVVDLNTLSIMTTARGCKVILWSFLGKTAGLWNPRHHRSTNRTDIIRLTCRSKTLH